MCYEFKSERQMKLAFSSYYSGYLIVNTNIRYYTKYKKLRKSSVYMSMDVEKFEGNTNTNLLFI